MKLKGFSLSSMCSIRVVDRRRREIFIYFLNVMLLS